ncbi:unnamed protein product [Albugo candida]|uniref:Uncharacterized protein n=1 Tax=Albugo candida TaxID=65357 RepID=A0A024GE47_9STRA|nr:unnamed protein product [Albugo candida]|eukprot:CCI44800.1 unnamed protein product [Albugo candida]
MYTESGIRLLDATYDSSLDDEETTTFTPLHPTRIRSVTSHFLQREHKLLHQRNNRGSNVKFRPYKPSHLSSESNQSPHPLFTPCSSESLVLEHPPQTTIHSKYTPQTLLHTLRGHENSVYSIQWNVRFPHLLLSASMDRTVRVWSIPALNQRTQDTGFLSRVHTGGVRVAKWTLSGTHYVSGGYDKQLVYVDVNAESVVTCISSTQPIRSIAIHPENQNIILTGQANQIVAYDLRSKATHAPSTFRKNFEQVHDLLFLPPVPNAAFGGYDLRFVSSASTKGRNVSNETLLVWDFRSSAVLYDRLESDGFEFPSLRAHPSNTFFVAQSSLHQAILFSCKAPYKRFKHKTFGKRQSCHLVEGYSLHSSFHPDGNFYASGDALGRIFYYNARSGAFVCKTRVGSNCACLCVEYHPSQKKPSLLAAATYNGSIHLFQ